MQIRSLGHRTDLRLLELAGSVVEDRGSHLVVRTPDDPTCPRGNVLLLARPPVPGGEREVIGAFRTEFPGAEHVSLGIDGTEDLAATAAPFADAGLEITSAVVLTASSLAPPRDLPEGVEVRPLESDDDWQQCAELSLALHPDADPAPFVRSATARTAQERALVRAAPGRRYGAFVEGLLVASAAAIATGDGMARFQLVATHPDHRRRGLAANVVHAAGTHALAGPDVSTLVVVAGPDDAAIRVLRGLGFVDAERQLLLSGPPVAGPRVAS